MVASLKRESPILTRKKKLIKSKAMSGDVKEDKKVTRCYCRRCMETKNITNFFSATDNYLDRNTYMSICKDCIGESYVRLFQSESNMENAMLRLCRILNWMYSQEAIEATKKHLETQEKTPDDPSVPGIYKMKIVSVSRKSVKKDGGVETLDLTFYEPRSSIAITDPLLDSDENSETLIEKWGAGMSYDDYVFLEKRLTEWKRDYSCQNKAELFFMKQLSFKELELEKARIEDKNVDPILKTMDNLLKSSALTPAQNTAASSMKTTGAWSIMLKSIEQFRPAEFYKDKPLFKDFDGLGVYITNYIKRPIMNFIGAGKSFELIDDDETAIELQEGKEEVIESNQGE